ncbi:MULTISPECIES: DUF350 domain-containing protein [unclassified Motilimonas]|uniref:DUF350 domain-containing protein n=1 Tax=Motilimonas TaxID=1914248 RepID=UPI001E3497BE|nr:MULTISPECIES: DUF350 domain-containing protein [unclassified Motilimonas]MCE0557939.1 DUF350 domain-containing protein [Motilimonas sp. E26]MDO6524743.1 DUF350 domain-containing protein [Motilimonas sp. 1_MG-2023]
MNTINAILEFNPELLVYLLIDVVIAILLLSTMRYIMGVMGKIDTTEELAKRDNFAYGISMAGSVLAMGIVLTGAITGESANNYLNEIIGMSVYGIAGLLLIKAGRWVHDKFSLGQFNKAQLILERNTAVAITDAASAIATAIIVRAVLIWVEGFDISTFTAILSGWLISQIILVLVSRIREKRYNQNNVAGFQHALIQGNVALAVRYSGHLIGTAVAVTAASHFVFYDPAYLVAGLLSWFAISLVMMVLLKVLAYIAKRMVLLGIKRDVEIEQQHNVGVASIEFAINVSIALVLSALMA